MLSCRRLSLAKNPLATFDNVMIFALVPCQKHGAPQSVRVMAAMGLLLAEHLIKTKRSVSSGACSSTPEHPARRPGQGSHVAPALWLIARCLLCGAMTKLCEGAKLCNPLQAASHQRTGDGFAGNMTSCFNFGLAAMLLHNHGLAELAKGLQEEEAQTWKRLLCLVGGQLEQSKCLCCLLIFDHKPKPAWERDNRHLNHVQRNWSTATAPRLIRPLVCTLRLLDAD